MRSILVVVFLVHVGASKRLHSHSHNFGAVQTQTDLSRLEQVTVGYDDSTIAVGFKHNPSFKHAGRHVCTSHRNITYPIKTKQVYCKPTIKKYQERCYHNQLCTNVRVVYERAYRDVVTTKQTKHLTYGCCLGWTQVHKGSHGCNKPVCNPPCQNGGSCVKPNTCQCPNGYNGNACELDIDECKDKPCDQICHNTQGSFRCECRENFILKEDGESCLQNSREETEVSEIEGSDLDIALYENRISKLEKMFGSLNSDELKKLQTNYKHFEKHITYMETKLNDMEQYKHDMQAFKNMLIQMEVKTSRVEEFMNKFENTAKSKYF